jgi:hypothetical protein
MLFKKWHPFFIALAMLISQHITGQNYALSLAQNQEDFINLDVSSTPLAGNPATFTVECWFYNQNNNANQFRRLFSFGNIGSGIEVGEWNGQLTYYLEGVGASIIGPNQVVSILANTWTHLAVVKTNNHIDFYIDCVLVGSTPSLSAITFNNDYFRLGRRPGVIAPDADWHGIVDELRLWQIALSPADICTIQYCPVLCNEPDLIAYWSFNDLAVVPGGNNTSITQVLDCSPNANHGTPMNVLQNGPISNWVNNAAPVAYPALHNLGLEVRDYPYKNNLLTGICNGDPAHFCLDDNGQTPGPYSNVSVQWQYSDNGGAWQAVNSPSFVDFCFPVAPGELTLPCGSSTDGFVDRKYRAVSTVTGPLGQQCDYTSTIYDLQICCPISPATVDILPTGPFCEGEQANFQVCLNSPDPFINIPGPNITIDWCYLDPVAGPISIPSAANQICFNYNNWTAPFPPGGTPSDYCFEAKVSNCQGKNAVFKSCVTVDPQPVCGTIEGFPLGAPQNLDLIGTNPLTYEICPGDDAILAIANPFQYCIPQWQYTFVNPTTANLSDWVNMGFSNNLQNTNILPSYYWPAGADRIYYRIQCTPLSSPSVCDPCFSDWIEIRLKQAPMVASITGPVQICLENLPAVLSVNTPQTGITYTWLHEGLVIGTGSSLGANVGGCYWLEASNGCQTVAGPPLCLDICETIARLSCPLPPNECALPNQQIELSACNAENTCTGGAGLLYEWFVDGVSQGTASSNCNFMHIPALTGTTYKVVVTDPVTACMGMTERTIIPCEPNN